MILFTHIKFYFYPFDALTPAGHFAGRRHRFSFPEFCLSSLLFLKFFDFPFDALRPRGGPYFLLLQKVGKDRRKGVSPPLRIPGPKWGAGTPPLWKPPSPRWRGKFSRTPRRLRGWSFGAVGEGRERVRARHGRRTSTASVLGASPPCPPTFPKGKRSPVTRLFWGLRPLAPKVPHWETSADHARQRMGTASETAFAAKPSQISRKLLPRKRLGVPSLPLARLCRRHSSATASGGNPKGGRSPLWPVFAYFLLARK